MSKRTRRQVFKVGVAVTAGILMVALPCLAQQLTNDELSQTVNAHRWDEKVDPRSRIALSYR